MQLDIVIRRRWFTNTTTIGEMFLNGERECFTLEDTVRKNQPKVPGSTAIPTGRYELAFSYSPTLKAFLPIFLNVPGFDYIRIHAGNTHENTKGCILVGRKKADTDNAIFESRLALTPLMEKLNKAMHQGPVYCSIA